MKSVYSIKYLDWLLLAVSFYYAILIFSKISFANTQLSTVFLVVLISISSLAFIGLIFKNKLSHEFNQLFLILVVVFPSAHIVYRYLADLIFYGINRVELLSDPFVFFQLIIGIGLLLLTSAMYVKK